MGFQVREDLADQVTEIIKDSMENSIQLKGVPLPVHVKRGQCWGALH